MLKITNLDMLDRHNDCLVIYAQQQGDRWRLTDDGETAGDLRYYDNFSLDETALAKAGIRLADDELTITVPEAELAAGIARLFEAMQQMERLVVGGQK